MAKRKLQDLNLIDDFLTNAMALNEQYGVLCYRRILSVLLGKELGAINVKAQSMICGEDTDLRGIRLDVEIEEQGGDSEITNIYDYEPHAQNDLNFPKHSRYYQAKVDGRYVRSGLTDFSKIHNLYVITITNFDIFGEDYMLYTIRNRCEEIPELKYEDGLTFLYFNTKGSKGGSESIRNMLKYIEDSRHNNAVDIATKEVAEYVDNIKRAPEVEAGFMTLQDKIDREKAEAYKEGRQEGRQELIDELLQKGIISDSTELDIVLKNDEPGMN